MRTGVEAMNFKPEDFENVGAWNSGGGIVLEVATHKATGLGIGLTSDCLVVYELTEDGDFEKPLFEINGDGSRWWESPWSDLVAELAEEVCEDICDAWAANVDGTIGEVNPTTALRYTYEPLAELNISDHDDD